jgi:gluconolactonase
MEAYEIADARFRSMVLDNATLETLGSECRWLEGPIWFADHDCLYVSDIPNDRILRWCEEGGMSVFRRPSGFANGHARDREGRLIGCSHQHRCVTRTELDGTVTILASHYLGKRLNSPNDIVCKSDGSIWFSDPHYGIETDYEGGKAQPELPPLLYRLNPVSGVLDVVADDFEGPNGLAFSPDESVLYIVESRAAPHRLIWAYDHGRDGKLSNKRIAADANGPGAFDGFRVDVDGNLWCGFGSNGALDANLDGLDGVRVFAPDGTAIGHIHLPERCANVCFGGRQRNRLFMAASHSVYALYVNTQGAS